MNMFKKEPYWDSSEFTVKHITLWLESAFYGFFRADTDYHKSRRPGSIFICSQNCQITSDRINLYKNLPDNQILTGDY